MINLFLRFISSIALVLLLVLSYFNSYVATILIISLYVSMIIEWFYMAKNADQYNYIFACGIIFIILSCSSVLYMSQYKKQHLIWCIAYVIFTDIFAMLGGKTFKGPKLAPKISPGKTWNGLLCGILSCIVLYEITLITPNSLFYQIKSASVHVDYIDLFIENLKYVLIVICISLISQLSDIFVSLFKRRCNVKDSGRFILGHGGFLDRFDGWILTMPFFLIVSSNGISKYFLYLSKL